MEGHFGDTVPKDTKDDVSGSEPNEDCVKLSESIYVFRNRTIGSRDNVFEGEVRSSVYGVRSCVIKFAEISEQNIREAEILTKLGSHTNVIAIIQSGTYCGGFEDRVYIALDKCHNENLRQYLANRKAAGIEFDLNQAIDFAKQIIVGVMYIHENNVIHLDLKPSNILISQNLLLIKIADFGLSIVVMSPKSKVFHMGQFGTNGYRPIESLGNGEVSMKTDIFSLGTVLLHLLSNGNDVFGSDEHTFIHNVTNDVTNTSGLLVPNPVATEHLIKCMVSKERCRRPSIWEVSDHPSWTGKEMECNFEYFNDVEVYDDVNRDFVEIRKEIVSISDIERGKMFLKKMREMGFNRKPMIAVLDATSSHLYRFDVANKSMTKMHGYRANIYYAAITLGEYIYLFDVVDILFSSIYEQTVHRLEYCNATATWEKLSWPDWNDEEGFPQVAASSDAIFLVGGYSNKTVSKYNPSSNHWERLPDRSFGLRPCVLYSNGFLYCFGGWDEKGDATSNVERLDLVTMKWTRLADMNNRPVSLSAVDCGRNIYVVKMLDFNLNDAIRVEIYDPQVDKWTELKHNIRDDFPKDRIDNVFYIQGDLYVLDGPRRMLKYELTTSEWSIVAAFPEMNFSDSVLVRMSD